MVYEPTVDQLAIIDMLSAIAAKLTRRSSGKYHFAVSAREHKCTVSCVITKSAEPFDEDAFAIHSQGEVIILKHQKCYRAIGGQSICTNAGPIEYNLNDPDLVDKLEMDFNIWDAD